MSWSWEADGIAGATVPTIDDAIAALARSLDQAAARYGTERQSEVARACVAPMSVRMSTDGARTIAEGREWSSECGGLRVTLTPEERPP